eukprot:sb/3476691/
MKEQSVALFDNPPGYAGWFFSPLSNNTVAMAIELVTMVTDILKVIRKYQLTSTGSSKSVSNSFTALYRLTNDFDDVHTHWLSSNKVFYEGALSLRYRLTNGHFDDVHLCSVDTA